MRQIILDTETTGLEPTKGHRIIEIGAIELLDRKFTGRTFHHYLNPDREIDAGAVAIHGITAELLQDKPRFAEIVADFILFVKDAELIIHNASFDVGFLNHELKLIKHPNTIHQICTVLDTLLIARERHPGQKNNLDALCKRYGVDNTDRKYHGALLDAELLGFVYLAMTAGQMQLFEENLPQKEAVKITTTTIKTDSVLIQQATEAEMAEHQAYLQQMTNPLFEVSDELV